MAEYEKKVRAVLTQYNCAFVRRGKGYMVQSHYRQAYYC